LDSPVLGGVERKGPPMELTPPSVGGSVRRPHAPPRGGRFFNTRGGEVGHLAWNQMSASRLSSVGMSYPAQDEVPKPASALPRAGAVSLKLGMEN
jgi:hypothetical protein